MTKNTRDTNKNKVEDKNSFEKELFSALKSYGYILPQNALDVDRFEELYGTTEIDTPSLIELNKNKSKQDILNMRNIDFDLSLSIAAFTSNESSSFELPDEIVNILDSNKPKKKK